MAIKYIKRISNLDGNPPVDILPGGLFTGESKAHVFMIFCRQGAQALALSGGTVSGDFLNANHQSVPCTGSVVNGVAVLQLPPACYSVRGRFTLTIYHTQDGATGAIYRAEGKVLVSGSDVAIDPGTVISSVAALIASIENVRDTLPPSYSDLLASIASAYADLDFPVGAGEYCWHEGALYQALDDIPAYETWTAAHWKATNIGADIGQLRRDLDGIVSVQPTTVTISKSNQAFTAYGTHGYVNINDGHFSSDVNYTCYLITFTQDTDISLARDGTSGLLGAVVYSQALDTLPISSTQSASYYVKGGRNDKTGDQALPSAANPWHVTSGQMLVVYLQDVRYTDIDFSLTYENGHAYKLSNDLQLNTAQEARVAEIAEGVVNTLHGDFDALSEVVDGLAEQVAGVEQYDQRLETVENDLRSGIPYHDAANDGTATKTGTVIHVTEKRPRNFSPLPLGTLVKGRNRFNLSSAAFAWSGYSSWNTVTKENNGIKTVSTMTSTSSSVYCYTEYTAEYTGDLYFSCEGAVDGNVRDVRVSAEINNTAQEILWGAGRMHMVLPVTAGDTVRLKFWSHAQTAAGSTCYYRNIMLAYGGLYEFGPYQQDLGYGGIDTMKEISLADYIGSGTNHSSGSGTGKYNVTIPELLSDLYALPSANTVAAQDVTALPTALGIITDSYNAVYNAGVSTSGISRGIGVKTNGDLVVYIDGMNRNQITAWLQTDPVTISYKIWQSSGAIPVDTMQIQEGMIIVLPESGTVTYNYYVEPRKKLVCFGDSITGIYGNKANYPEWISLMAPIDTVNVGFSGLTYTDHSNTGRKPFSLNRLIDAVVSDDFSYQDASSYVDPEDSNYTPLYAEHLANLKAVDWTKVDYVSFFYGTNDYTAGAYLASEDDPAESNKQRTNIEDAVNYCVTQLLTKYPHLRIMVLAPYWMTFSGQDANEHLNNKGKYLHEYCAEIESVSNGKYNLPTLNMYHMFGINAITKWFFQKDDAHPTERLKLLIAENIIDMIGKN